MKRASARFSAYTSSMAAVAANEGDDDDDAFARFSFYTSSMAAVAANEGDDDDDAFGAFLCNCCFMLS